MNKLHSQSADRLPTPPLLFTKKTSFFRRSKIIFVPVPFKAMFPDRINPCIPVTRITCDIIRITAQTATIAGELVVTVRHKINEVEIVAVTNGFCPSSKIVLLQKQNLQVGQSTKIRRQGSHKSVLLQQQMFHVSEVAEYGRNQPSQLIEVCNPKKRN